MATAKTTSTKKAAATLVEEDDDVEEEAVSPKTKKAVPKAKKAEDEEEEATKPKKSVSKPKASPAKPTKPKKKIVPVVEEDPEEEEAPVQTKKTVAKKTTTAEKKAVAVEVEDEEEEVPVQAKKTAAKSKQKAEVVVEEEEEADVEGDDALPAKKTASKSKTKVAEEEEEEEEVEEEVEVEEELEVDEEKPKPKTTKKLVSNKNSKKAQAKKANVEEVEGEVEDEVAKPQPKKPPKAEKEAKETKVKETKTKKVLDVTSAVTTTNVGTVGKAETEICLFASQVAVITGNNHYQELWELFEKVWQRSFPLSFARAKKAAETQIGTAIKSPEELLVDHLKNYELDAKWSKSVQSSAKADLSTTEQEEINAEFETQVDKSAAPDAIKEFIRKQHRHQKNTSYGTLNESVAIKNFTFQTSIQVRPDPKFRKKRMGITAHSNIPWSLGGRIDGLAEGGKLLEIKNRTKQIFTRIPAYENIQFQCYLHLLDQSSGTLAQRLKTNTTGELVHTEIARDDALFKEYMIPQMQVFCDYLDFFVNAQEPALAQEFLTYDEARKKAFIDSTLRRAMGQLTT